MSLTNGALSTDELVAELRLAVSDLHAELPRNGLVAWTSGNVSARVPGTDLMVIKPSGISYDDLTPESMVLCDLDGNPIGDGYSPSSDTATHAYIYRHMPEVGGVVHTHSTYATAWAALGDAGDVVVVQVLHDAENADTRPAVSHGCLLDRVNRAWRDGRPAGVTRAAQCWPYCSL